MDEDPLSREERLRRMAKLCVHIARNMAYYRAARDQGERITPATNFWNTADANFIDMAVLEWWKIFADRNGHQSWRKVVSDPEAFEAALLDALGMSNDQFETMLEPIRVYRDKFLAHLDSQRVMHIPRLDPMWAAVLFAYRHILSVEMTQDEASRVGLPDLEAYYGECFAEARAVYQPPASPALSPGRPLLSWLGPIIVAAMTALVVVAIALLLGVRGD